VLAVYFYRENDRELREAKARLSFVNQVSHELKTPLTSIRMYAEMLENDLNEGDETQRRRLEVIVSESQRLSRLIANVLTFGRRNRNGLRLNWSAGLVDEVVANVVRQFEPVLARKGIRIDCQGTASREAEFDRDALEQMLGNLLGNAEKYAVGAERVRIDIEQDGRWVRLVVADDGPGIPAKEQKCIFEPFYRISNKLTDGVTGTGIGLTIARDLARLHGGDLTLEPSEKGASFRLVVETRPTESGGTA
jgi:signal transduction histidine kinase